MSYVEKDEHLWFLTDKEEVTHEFLVINRQQVISYYHISQKVIKF